MVPHETYRENSGSSDFDSKHEKKVTASISILSA